MSNLKFDGQELPDWLDHKLKQMSPEPNANTLFQLLLEDYIARHKPCEHEFEKVQDFWDPNIDDVVVKENDRFCRKCGVKK